MSLAHRYLVHRETIRYTKWSPCILASVYTLHAVQMINKPNSLGDDLHKGRVQLLDLFQIAYGQGHKGASLLMLVRSFL